MNTNVPGSAPTNRYWCHECTKEIVPNIDDNSSQPTVQCSECGGDFVELMETTEEQLNQPESSQMNQSIPNQSVFDQPPPDFLQLLQQIQNVISGAAGGGRPNGMNNFQAFQLFPGPGMMGQFSFNNLGNGFNIGNLGDYAFGNRFDDLLNQLFVNSQSRGTPPASAQIVNNLPQTTIEENEVTECAICKDEFEVGSTATELPCSHKFHGECVNRWLAMHNQCPVCRFELPTDDIEYEQRKQQNNQ
eukprot:TRINITY_DN13401_c0_g1_i1.p1 TRINITY_DN13401_c0_g1~~TRINITY_DN13401_c0_g1_i1.p1  ORF type:complete len:267 (-),score=46.09 TRINITY_DN13401_c0_g1_i1:20-757(-)